MSKALKTAIEANDPDAVRKAIKTVKDINRKLPGSLSPLLCACAKGADQVLEVLFEAGAIAEKRNTFPGDTPFAIAAQHQQAKVLERLWAMKQASDAAVAHALESAAMEGHQASLDLILKTVKPRITIGLFRLACVPENSPAILQLLIKHGGDVHVRQEDGADKGATLFHEAAANGKTALMRTVLQCGAEVNARDDLGRTPLMMLAEQLEWIERSESEAQALLALKTLLDLGADATLTDHFGNDAITHCECEYARSRSQPNAQFVNLLRQAGASGSGATGKLFDALRKKDVTKMRAAIAEGAGVNRVMPGGSTALCWADSEDVLDVLLGAGADPNKPGLHRTPLIGAAGSGHLAVVKKLIAAGADIHSVYQSGEFRQNAYLAAEMNRKFEVVDYLKSLGAGNPKPAESEPLKPGVGSWNDFSEMLVKSTVEQAAEALAKIIKGKVLLSLYGQSLLPGKKAYVVARPKGMNWCNVFQIAPQRQRFEDSKKTEAFAAELAKVAAASVLSIEYSDTSDAASVLRIEPDAKKIRDTGWDRETLEEMVESMGADAPAWAKKQLAKTGEDEPRSTERLEMLAKHEKFIVAAFGMDCEPGRKLDVEFVGYGADAFDGVAFVSN